MIVKDHMENQAYDRGDWSQSRGSLVNSSAIVAIIWKLNFYSARDHQRSQRLPTVATIAIAAIE